LISIEFFAPESLTLTSALFAVNSDDVLATADLVTEQPNAKGAYIAQFSESLTGPHLLVGYDAGIAVVAAYASLSSGVAVHRSGNYADVVVANTVELLRKIALNKTVTDPVTGLMTVFDDDDSTPLLNGALKEDVAETQPYRGRGAEVRRRLE